MHCIQGLEAFCESFCVADDNDEPTNSEHWHLLNACAKHLENTVAAMKEILSAALPDRVRQTITRSIEEGEALISQLRDTLAN